MENFDALVRREQEKRDERDARPPCPRSRDEAEADAVWLRARLAAAMPPDLYARMEVTFRIVPNPPMTTYVAWAVGRYRECQVYFARTNEFLSVCAANEGAYPAGPGLLIYDERRIAWFIANAIAHHPRSSEDPRH